MIRNFVLAAVLGLGALCAPAAAALDVGAVAPDFTSQASLGGKVFTFHLADALKKGPVVLYFYPAAFTTGCTIEAHDFADAMPQFSKMHATVIGVSHDNIDTLNKFSVSECRSKFPVAADPDLSVAKSYDSILKQAPQYADRTSYLIDKDGKIAYVYTSLNPDKHVSNLLDALQTIKAP